MSELKPSLIQFITKSLKEIEPDLNKFYENIDSYVRNITPEKTKNYPRQNVFSRLASTVSGLSLGSLGYTQTFQTGNFRTANESILGDLITELFGTSIFSDILMIGDNILSTVLSLLTFWNLGENATQAVKKSVAENFMKHMEAQECKICEECATELSKEVSDTIIEIPNIGKGLSEEINQARRGKSKTYQGSKRI